MSEQTDDNSSSDENNSDEQPKRNFRRELEDRAVAAEKRAQELERKLAFRDAGLDPSNKQHAIYMKAYDGDLDAGKIRADAEDAGFLTQVQTTAPQGEIDTHARINAASLNAQPVAPVSGKEEQFKAILEASNQKDFLAAVNAAGLMAKG